MTALADAVEHALGVRPVSLEPLGGGCVADVRLARLPSGERVVVKHGGTGANLDLEGRMLAYLAQRSTLPVPAVRHASPSLLVMDYVETSGGISESAQEHAADLVAALHDITSETFGFDEHTLIGSLRQPNPRTESWIDFFRAHRLLDMTAQAERAGRLPADLASRLRRFAERLDGLLLEPEAPSLLHGDLWAGNVLCRDGRIAAFIDPAVYYGHAEIELAFTTLFGTFGEPFFRRYREHRTIEDGFFERRRDIYSLYPLLVHVRLFGGGYVASVHDTLRRLGA